MEVERTLDGIRRFTEGLNVNVNMGKKPPIRVPKIHRGHLAQLFAELGFRSGAEIGVQKGAYSLALAKANPAATLYCIDPWEAYEDYEEPYTPESIEAIYQEARERLDRDNCVIMRMYSMDAVTQFEDGELDFVYIDANHEFEHVVQDIKYWSEKVRRGGIISGHDWARYPKSHPATIHVKDVVNAWTYSHRIRPWFVCGRDSSWFWVNGSQA